MKTLILGGVRSGKSRYAEQLAIASAQKKQGKLIYIATSFPQDKEMQQRVDEHQKQRKSSKAQWITIEETLHLADVLKQQSDSDTTILVDCLTLWMTNLLCHSDTDLLKLEASNLLTTLPQLEANIIFVSNETGLGIVPMDKLTREFIDKMGLFHQDLATLCDQVDFVIAGLAMSIKSKND